MKWVYKADIHKLPIIGQTVQLGGDHPLYFTKDKGGWGTKAGAVKNLMDRVHYMGVEMDIATVLYPEGTRSRTGQLQPFKEGFFKFAVDHDWDILPCGECGRFLFNYFFSVGHNNQSLWPLGSFLLGVGTVYFAIGDPIRPLENETAAELKERVREAMAGMIREMPLYDPQVSRVFIGNE